VRLIVFVCDRVPLVPSRVIVYVPSGVPAATVKVACEVPLPVTDGGENTAVTPSGRVSACKVTVDEKPPTAAIETAELALCPCATVIIVGNAVREKSGAAFTVRFT